GCATQGYGEALGKQLFDIIEPFADYAFNKSHSYGYGLVAYQTAWLKANHPVEYLAALLSSVKGDKDKTAIYLSECRTLGIEVRVPDVNASSSNFTTIRGTAQAAVSSGHDVIVFGLSAVRNVGEAIVEHIVAARELGGPFVDFYDFCRRVDSSALNKRAVESLAKAGAFDSLGHPRKGLCLAFEAIIERALVRRREQEQGIATLFSLFEQEADDAAAGGASPASFDGTWVAIPNLEFDKAERLAFEKEMLGLYVSDHPLMGLEKALRDVTDVTIRDLLDSAAGPDAAGDPAAATGPGGWTENVTVTTGGVVTALVRRYTRRGELMATFVLEDLEAAIEVMVFPKTMLEYGGLLEQDAIVAVRGRLDLREDQPKFICRDLRRLALTTPGSDPPVEVVLPLNRLTDSLVRQIRDLVSEHPGNCAVHLRVGEKVLRLPPQFNVNPRGGLVGALKELLGTSAVAR
ncbi:MAG: OB-fold nucleic acid binding domain-containing protein, partial [Acidimicrobiales bacterium]